MDRTKGEQKNTTYLTPEQANKIFDDYIAGIHKLFDEHAALRARMIIDTVKREFGIDLTEKNPNAEALLFACNRRHFDDVLAKATERFVKTQQKN